MGFFSGQVCDFSGFQVSYVPDKIEKSTCIGPRRGEIHRRNIFQCSVHTKIFWVWLYVYRSVL